jgi:hypothetical protein
MYSTFPNKNYSGSKSRPNKYPNNKGNRKKKEEF